MRSSLYSGPSRPPPNTGSSTNQYEMEDAVFRENEAMLGTLGNSVAQMKAMAGNLNREAEEQNTLLKDLREAFTTASRGVGSSISGLRKVMDRYGWKHTLLFGVAVFVVLLLVYRYAL